jgi:expansin (peptidoglycan-binding protein)
MEVPLVHRSRSSALILAALLGALFTGAIALGQQQQRIYLPLLGLPSQPPSPTPGPQNPTFTGEGTYYFGADGGGNCSFDPTPQDLMVGAMNEQQYASADLCGAYVAITGPSGSVTVRITDRCPECQRGDIDLSPEAFDRIAARIDGRVPISWRVVSPAISGPIAYHFKEGSNQWWTAVQVRNHRNPIAKLEYRDGAGQWVEVPRLQYNYFVQDSPSGMGPGPYSFRVTDIYGNELVDSGIPHVEAGTVSGAGQFPPGP